jgi:mycothiol S-conjugate amidase
VSAPPDHLRLLAVHAHPDDESSKGAATLARYAAEGADVMVVTCTGGERGSVLNPKLQGDAELASRLPELRRQEMAAASAILGVHHRWLGFVDSGLPEGDPRPPPPEGSFAALPAEEGAARLVRLVREFRPHVMTTYDETGGYPHPDHLRCHEISVAAFDAAADPDRFPGEGEPWEPLKLYYSQDLSRSRLRALHDGLVARGLPSPFAEMLERRERRAPQDRPTRPVARVPCADYFPLRDAALRAHATQVDPDGPWFQVAYEIQREVWPVEEFQLARSRVATVEPEDDLFAGLRPQLDAGRPPAHEGTAAGG